MRAPTMQPSDAVRLYRREKQRAERRNAPKERKLLEQAAREFAAWFMSLPAWKAGRKAGAE